MGVMSKRTVQLKANEQGDLPLLQITDTHLFSDRDKTLLGIKTVDSYAAVVQHATKYTSKCLAVLSTGDLSQDNSPLSYIDFTNKIKALEMPCFWLPGNHDKQSVMLPSLLAEGLAKTTQIVSEHWQIIMLDSQVEGVPYGELADTQLDFLKQALEEFPNKHTLICLHHHVLPIGSAWLDQHILINADAFLAVIAPFSHIKAVLGGHVHQESEKYHQDILFMTTPSTCVQFKPNSEDFELDTKAPGYRYLSLNKSGTIKTWVERIETDNFIADAGANGY